MNIHIETATFGGEPITLETGRIARQTDASVVVRQGESFVLGAVCVGETTLAADHVPLTVLYRELMSAAGRIPGNFLRRESRSTEHEVLVSRMCDRLVRPLLPSGFRREIHLTITVFAAAAEADLTGLALIASAAALHSSPIPFAGPAVGALLQRKSHDVQLYAACTRDGVVMLEGSAKGAPEHVLLELLDELCRESEPLMDAMDRLAGAAPRPDAQLAAAPKPALCEVVDLLREQLGAQVVAAYSIAGKRGRRAALAEARTVATALLAELGEPGESGGASDAFGQLCTEILRARLLDGVRSDGRTPAEIREIACEVGLLKTCHGSALFQRGDTQVLVSCTVGERSDAAARDTLQGRHYQRFLVHYNFPPYAVGDARMMRGPGRRETGHGSLAQRALAPSMPGSSAFPKTVRILSETTESDGSSSMATVSGGSLALMDAGVPTKAAVAGVAMGLVLEGDRHVILSDILSDEDFAGDMDFKVAGTLDGVTAVQLDTKRTGLPIAIVREALSQALTARQQLLQRMAEILETPRAPEQDERPCVTLELPKARIGQLIGPGGRNITQLQSETSTVVQVTDEGKVTIRADTDEKVAAARRRIEELLVDLREGGLYIAQVTEVREYGSIVRVGAHGGLVHISELTQKGREAQAGDTLLICALGVDNRGRLLLSERAAEGRKREDAVNHPVERA